MSDTQADTTPVKEQPAVVADTTTLPSDGQADAAAPTSAAATPARLNANAKSFVPTRLDESAVAASGSAVFPSTPSAAASTTKSTGSTGGGGATAATTNTTTAPTANTSSGGNPSQRKDRNANTPSSSQHNGNKRGSNAGQHANKGNLPNPQHPPMIGIGGLPLPPGMIPGQFAPHPFGGHFMLPGQSPHHMMMNPMLIGQPNTALNNSAVQPPQAHHLQGPPPGVQVGTPSHQLHQYPQQQQQQQQPLQQQQQQQGGGSVGVQMPMAPPPQIPPTIFMGPNGPQMMNPAAMHALMMQQQQLQLQMQHESC